MQDSLPKFPFPEGPRDYQKKALDAWIENKYKGFFAMATGTGKTSTMLLPMCASDLNLKYKDHLACFDFKM